MRKKQNSNSFTSRLDQATAVGCAGPIITLLCCGCAAFETGLPAVFVLYTVPIVPNTPVEWDGRNFTFAEFGFASDILYRVDLPSADVANFYRKEMAEQGWELTKEKAEGPGLCLTFQRWKRLQVHVTLLGKAAPTTVIVDAAHGCSGISN